ncbi:hypothetical protein Bbelb_066770 [Branchiostoma belcheri]|nr:hypothetical protein Bbelb_066770 [Branchiostoma belcheri]
MSQADMTIENDQGGSLATIMPRVQYDDAGTGEELERLPVCFYLLQKRTGERTFGRQPLDMQKRMICHDENRHAAEWRQREGWNRRSHAAHVRVGTTLGETTGCSE